MARKIVIFQNFENLSFFKFAYFYRLSNTNQFSYCCLLDITCTLLPATGLVSIWFRLDMMCIFVSIVKHTILQLPCICCVSMATNSYNFSY